MTISTVALIAISPNVPLTEFARDLETAISETCTNKSPYALILIDALGPVALFRRQDVARLSGISADLQCSAAGASCELTDWLSAQV